ncbi:MAG: transglutaminase family protein [Pseudomonadota bacterium]
MSLIKVGCELEYNVTQQTNFMIQVAAAETPYQRVTNEKFIVTPAMNATIKTIGEEGNRIVRLQAQPGTLQIQYEALVDLHPDLESPPDIGETPYEELPDSVLHYLNPSRYCESDRLSRMAWRTFGNVAPGYSRVQKICDWTHDHLNYLSGSTDARTSACDSLIQGAGVCRDYAHVAITLCRALCIPARYVSGYAVGLQPPDFHGFFEAYLDNSWYLFDATKMVQRSGLVRIGTGRDASDASFATVIGAAILLKMNVHAEQQSPDKGKDKQAGEMAISTV